MSQHLEDVERKFRILPTNSSKIVSWWSQKNGRARCLCSGRISTTIKYRPFRKSVSPSFAADQLLSAVWSRLEDFYTAFLYDKQFMTVLAFREKSWCLLRTEGGLRFRRSRHDCGALPDQAFLGGLELGAVSSGVASVSSR